MTSKELEHLMIDNDFDYDSSQKVWIYKKGLPCIFDDLVQDNPEVAKKLLADWGFH